MASYVGYDFMGYGVDDLLDALGGIAKEEGNYHVFVRTGGLDMDVFFSEWGYGVEIDAYFCGDVYAKACGHVDSWDVAEVIAAMDEVVEEVIKRSEPKVRQE